MSGVHQGGASLSANTENYRMPGSRKLPTAPCRVQGSKLDNGESSNKKEPMKDMPIEKLLEAVKGGYATVKHEVEIPEGRLWTFGNSAFVHVFPKGSEWSEYVENQKLADAIRERCAG